MWIVNVVTDDVRICNSRLFWDICLAINYFDTFCISTLNWFADPEALWVELLLHLKFFILILLSEYITDRRNVEVFRKLAPESAHVEPEVCLVAELEGTREMSDFLILVDVFDLFQLGLFVSYIVDIEVRVFFHDLPEKLLCLFVPLSIDLSPLPGLEETEASSPQCLSVVSGSLLVIISN